MIHNPLLQKLPGIKNHCARTQKRFTGELFGRETGLRGKRLVNGKCRYDATTYIWGYNLTGKLWRNISARFLAPENLS
ncbi:hypothetical protein AMTR_s00090p00157710 [Amborella trichopoda]|uniref:Uncharacterized protein n=1 Tax=Amborella trichopoda TaxID=13333 RepID=W1P253_AMBTC|nr:hypothetical protein AMTR_s00090p00157710 [Amborella trichopoda]